MSDAGIIDLRFCNKQFPQSRQILEVDQPRTRDFRSGEIKFLKVLKPSQVNQIGISDSPLAKIDAYDPFLIATFWNIERNFYGPDTTHYPHCFASGRIAHMGLQPQLGLRSQRRPGNGVDHCGHPDVAGTDLTP